MDIKGSHRRIFAIIPAYRRKAMRHTKALAVIAGVLSCAVFLGGMAHAGDVYKYVDERGTTLYTDKPIPGAVLVSTGTQRPPEAAARTNAANQAATTAQLTASNQRIADYAGRRARRRERRQGSRSITCRTLQEGARRLHELHQFAASLSRDRRWQARIPERCRARASSASTPPRPSNPSAAPKAERTRLSSVPMLNERRPLDGVFLCGACA